MTNEQKRALRKMISGLGLVAFLIAPLTELYSTEVGLLIAIVIWVLGLPALTLFGFGVEEKTGDAAPAKSSRALPIVLIVLLAVFLSAWAIGGLAAYLISAGPHGRLQTKTRTVARFDRVELTGGGRLIIDQTGKEGLKIEAPAGLIDKLESGVRGGTLTLRRKPTWWFCPIWTTREVVYRLSVDDLSGIAIRGSGNVSAGKLKADKMDLTIDGSGRAKLDLDVDTVDARVSGSGKFVFSGKARREKIEINGSGEYDAKNLKAADADVDISGSGNAVINSEKNLDVSISGSGKVEYLGSPAIDQQISGSGSIVRIK